MENEIRFQFWPNSSKQEMESFLIYIFSRSTRKLYLYLQLYKATEEKSIENHLRVCNMKYKHFPLFFSHGLYCIGMAQIVLTTVISRKLATLGRCFFPIGLMQFWQHRNSQQVYFTKGSGWSKYSRRYKESNTEFFALGLNVTNQVTSLYSLNSINLPKDELFFNNFFYSWGYLNLFEYLTILSSIYIYIYIYISGGARILIQEGKIKLKLFINIY